MNYMHNVRLILALIGLGLLSEQSMLIAVPMQNKPADTRKKASESGARKKKKRIIKKPVIKVRRGEEAT